MCLCVSTAIKAETEVSREGCIFARSNFLAHTHALDGRADTGPGLHCLPALATGTAARGGGAQALTCVHACCHERHPSCRPQPLPALYSSFAFSSLCLLCYNWPWAGFTLELPLWERPCHRAGLQQGPAPAPTGPLSLGQRIPSGPPATCPADCRGSALSC